MAVAPYGDVGIVSNPDNRTPSDPSQALTVPANNADIKCRNVTINVSGRRINVYPRDVDPYAVNGNN